MMMFQTTAGTPITGDTLCDYFKMIINLFFKILPLREEEDVTLPVYIKSFQCELLGFQALIEVLHGDPQFISLISILQYLADHPSCEISTVKREVFRAISICNKLSSRYADDGKRGESL